LRRKCLIWSAIPQSLRPRYCRPCETIKYLQRTTSGATGYKIGTAIRYLRGAASVSLGTTINYLRRTTSGAAGSELGTTANFLRRARRRGHRPEYHDQVTATHKKRSRGQQLGHRDK
jgi:hypothetical protein